MLIKKVGVIEILAKDFSKLLAFYRTTLGFKIFAIEKEHQFVMFDTGTAKLSLFGATRFSRGKHSHVKLYFPTSNIKKTYGELKRKGVKFTSRIEKRHWGKVISFVDPEHNEHYLYQENWLGIRLTRHIAEAKVTVEAEK